MRFTNLITLGTLIAVIGLCSTAAALPVVIADNYWGADDHNYGDVIGQDSYFDIDRIEVDFSSGNLVVDVYTRYLDNVGQYGTGLGDLFISDNGWTPFGTSPYEFDNAGNGEGWEYVLVTGDSGIAKLYDISQGTIKESQEIVTSSTVRDGQEVRFIPYTNEAYTAGTWGINTNGTSVDTDDYLSYVISMDALGNPTSLGLHWAMTCANDVIEGNVAPVPEPSTILLLGGGLLGLGIFARRKSSK